MTSQKLKKQSWERGSNVTDISFGIILIGANRFTGGAKGEGECPSVTLSTTNPTWTDVTSVIRDEKPATDVYPICKSAQTHQGK
jgi:hypothetical protein